MYAVIAEPPRDFHNWVSKAENPSIKAPSRLLTQNHACELGPHLWNYNTSSTKFRFISLRCNSCLRARKFGSEYSVGLIRINSPLFSRLRAPFVVGPNRKSLRLFAFKSNGQNDEAGDRSIGSKSLKKSVGFLYAPPESEMMLVESLKAHSVPAYPSDTEPTASSLVVWNLFKSWLMLLRMPSARQSVDETLEETSRDTSGTEYLTQHNEKTRIMKAAWCYFMGLNATIKIPMLIFIPSYVAVNLMYGPEVAKDLYPLWIFGPLIVAVYVKLLLSIWGLYVFSFKQSVKVLKNVPTFFQVAYGYIFSGQLKEHVRSLLQPLFDIKNMDYKEASMKMLRNFNSWVAEKYMDYVESIWPFYCRTIRFLKRANLL